MDGRAEVVDAVTNEIARRAIDCAFAVHRALGPGLLESVYEACLACELGHAGLQYRRQFPLPVVYRELELEAGYRLDLLVENRIVIEIKAVEAIAPVHVAQTLTYLRLSGCKLGYLINFNVSMLKDGIKRLVV